MAAGDPQGWESLGVNDPTRYKATLKLLNSSRRLKDNIRVITDRTTGNYDVYQVTLFGDTLIYQHNASTGSNSIRNDNLYVEYFTGKNSNQLRNLTQSVRSATLTLAKNNISGSTSRQEYQDLQAKPGYRSLSNTSTQTPKPTPTPTQNPDATPDPGAPAEPAVPGEDAPGGIGTDVDGDGVISQGVEEVNPLLDTKSRGGATKILRYPYHVPPAGFEYDYISITAHDYQPSGLDIFGGEYGSDKYYKANKNLGKPYETVYFPMQPQLSETNAVSWSDDQLNPVQALLGKTAEDAIRGIGNLNLGQIYGAFTNLNDSARLILEDPKIRPFINAYFAGQAVSANLIGRSTGMVINPNLELLFNGPNLRTFNFNFRLTPRSQDESEEIRRIIRAFKRNMAVSRSGSNFFLTSPRIFELKYIYKGGGDHPYLNKFKPCALSNFGVNYTPDGSYATFDSSGSLTAYDLTMSFSEIMPIYADDIPDNTEVTMGY